MSIDKVLINAYKNEIILDFNVLHGNKKASYLLASRIIDTSLLTSQQ